MRLLRAGNGSGLQDVVCMMGTIFLGRILPAGVGGGGYPPPYDGRPGREDERIPVRICSSPRRICKKIHAICQKTRGYTKKWKQNYISPPIKEMGCEIYRFPKTKMTYEKSRCGSKSTSSLTIGTRAVRFKTQRPNIKRFAVMQGAFLYATQPILPVKNKGTAFQSNGAEKVQDLCVVPMPIIRVKVAGPDAAIVFPVRQPPCAY